MRAPFRSPGTEPARFWSAAPDGSVAYYTEAGALWRYDVEGPPGREREEVVPASAHVDGLIGASEEGEPGAYLYVVAEGALAGTGAQTLSCKEANRSGTNLEAEEAEQEEEGRLPSGRGCNLYVLHGGAAHLIATLSPRDDAQTQAGEYGEIVGGDWRPSLGSRIAKITPNGQSLVFQSILSLTGYSTLAAGDHTNEHYEVFVYEAPGDRLSCASCSPTDEAPASLPTDGAGTYLPISVDPTYMRRWLSEDGSRVFFDTDQPLVAADANDADDVYEWSVPTPDLLCGHRAEWRRVRRSALLRRGVQEAVGGSNATSHTGEDAYLLDASADGADVFIITRASLLPNATSETYKLYDARELGGFAGTSELQSCPDGECRQLQQARGSLPEAILTIGAGNPAWPAPKPSGPAPETRAMRLKAALKACRGKRDARKRRACESLARKRYGAKKSLGGRAAADSGKGPR